MIRNHVISTVANTSFEHHVYMSFSLIRFFWLISSFFSRISLCSPACENLVLCVNWKPRERTGFWHSRGYVCLCLFTFQEIQTFSMLDSFQLLLIFVVFFSLLTLNSILEKSYSVRIEKKPSQTPVNFLFRNINELSMYTPTAVAV